MVWCRVAGIDAERFDLIDRLKDALDAWPAADVEENVATWVDTGHRRTRGVLGYRENNMDARHDRAVLVRCPADERESSIGSKADDARPPVNDPFLRDTAKANPVLDLAFDPHQADARHAVARLPTSVIGRDWRDRACRQDRRLPVGNHDRFPDLPADCAARLSPSVRKNP